MKPKLNPDYPTTGVLILVLVSAIVALAVGMSGISVVREGLKTERVYSVAVVFGNGNKVYKGSSPIEYWTMIGLYSAACIGGFGLGICVPISNVKAYVKKRARQKSGGSK
jgi:phosphate/sulfate permease